MTPEETDRFGDMIAEARKDQLELDGIKDRSLELLIDLNKHLDTIIDNLNLLNTAQGRVGTITDEDLEHYLRTFPSDQIGKA